MRRLLQAILDLEATDEEKELLLEVESVWGGILPEADAQEVAQARLDWLRGMLWNRSLSLPTSSYSRS